ncbi:phosphonate C-P lyase system protein PhnH [Yoonia sp.]|uniref:phosphonate C-P lyase system protein PhnH n=1 Tax=Yoonia sp. TaxID=2212373 RepID=UPI00391B79A8
MTAHPAPSDFEAQTNATYAALMWALSRPGLIHDLPEAGQAQIIAALIDRECKVHSADPALTDVALRAGAALVEFDAADHVFAASLPQADVLRQLRCGSDLYPEEGATLVLNADLSVGTALRLTGPGIDGAVELSVGGLPDGFWSERARSMRYPMGFEIFLIDGSRVLGLPRSTKAEVL